VKNIDSGNLLIAKSALYKLKITIQAKQQGLAPLIQPFLDDPLPEGMQKVINIRNMKLFLSHVAQRGL
jgi:hypothetical protein